MNLTIQVDPELAVALLTNSNKHPAAGNLLSILSGAQASLLPLDPNQDDPELSRYFNIAVPKNGETALRDTLLKTDGVTAAYISPAPELP